MKEAENKVHAVKNPTTEETRRESSELQFLKLPHWPTLRSYVGMYVRHSVAPKGGRVKSAGRPFLAVYWATKLCHGKLGVEPQWCRVDQKRLYVLNAVSILTYRYSVVLPSLLFYGHHLLMLSLMFISCRLFFCSLHLQNTFWLLRTSPWLIKTLPALTRGRILKLFCWLAVKGTISIIDYV